MKATETKYIETGENNVQLYHNVGQSTLPPIIPFTPKSIPGMFNYWATIAQGPARDQRIGDKITPVGMLIKMFLASKPDRDYTMFRVIVARLPKVYNGGITGTIFDPFQGTGTGNRMLLQADSDIGVRFLYDRIYQVGKNQSANTAGKQRTGLVKLYIKRRKNNRPIIFNQNLQQIVNNPIAVYVIPYEQFSTFETDNIANMDYRCRLYYKDV